MNTAMGERKIGPLVNVDALLVPNTKRVWHLSVVEFTRIDHRLLRTGFGRIEDRGSGIASAHLASARNRASTRAILVDEVHLAKSVRLEIDFDSGERGLSIATNSLRNIGCI